MQRDVLGRTELTFEWSLISSEKFLPTVAEISRPQYFEPDSPRKQCTRCQGGHEEADQFADDTEGDELSGWVSISAEEFACKASSRIMKLCARSLRTGREWMDYAQD